MSMDRWAKEEHRIMEEYRIVAENKIQRENGPW